MKEDNQENIKLKNNSNKDIIAEEKEKIKNYIEKNKQKLKDYMYIAIYSLFIFITLFTVANFIKTKTNFYRNDLKFRWDNVLSYDDIFYSKSIYTSEKKYESTVSTIVKHPFMRVIGHGFVIVENALFSNMNKTDHYFHIVVFQIIINLIGVIYLYKILREQFKLKNRWCLLLLTIYEMATVAILGTLIVETFLISGTLLIMSYYYLSKQKKVASIIIGILTTGVTVTNCIPFALMAIFLLKDKKDILKVGVSCAIGFMTINLMLPYREILFSNFINMVENNANKYSKEQTGITYINMILYNLIISPIFFIKQIHIMQKGLDLVTFDLMSSKIVGIMTMLFFIGIIYNIIKNRKNRNMLAALVVFIYNMILHGVVKFGLYEGTIYGLHFLFAEILMFAFGFNNKDKKIKYTFIIFAIIMLLVQIRYNMKGLLELLLLFKDWK